MARCEHVREARRVDRAQVEPHVVGAVRVDALEDRGGELTARSELVGAGGPGEDLFRSTPGKLRMAVLG
ncbi:MAG TPA: hypothetical protein VKR21_18840 [Solirubrobacteraceae bacterium]|nr:hypothetical protein [Solirubrobacteraceae bacterium]